LDAKYWNLAAFFLNFYRMICNAQDTISPLKCSRLQQNFYYDLCEIITNNCTNERNTYHSTIWIVIWCYSPYYFAINCFLQYSVRLIRVIDCFIQISQHLHTREEMAATYDCSIYCVTLLFSCTHLNVANYSLAFSAPYWLLCKHDNKRFFFGIW